jgi:stage V sporulation protein SpoVS
MIQYSAEARAPFKVREVGDLTQPRQNEIWARANDDVHKLAADILDMVDYDKPVPIDVACIGAGCLNQAIKAIAVARERISRDAYDIALQPYFSSFTDDQDRSRTRIVLRLVVVDVFHLIEA